MNFKGFSGQCPTGFLSLAHGTSMTVLDREKSSWLCRGYLGAADRERTLAQPAARWAEYQVPKIVREHGSATASHGEFKGWMRLVKRTEF
jgi:hypothetical protein